MTRLKTLVAAALASVAVTFAAPAAYADGHSKNIVETAAGNDNFSTLVAAVTAAGLGDALSGEGPFTVFAPTNDAFAALPAGTVENLLKPENKDQLVKILTSHVVSGNITAETLVGLIKKGHGYVNVTTLSGDVITARADDKGVYIFDESQRVTRVTTVDLGTSNGVIHVINQVMLPK
ncbi:MAG: fasciclin domain-containing protein [Pseudomonadota bacterium]